jgi:hypothetical protein
MIHLSEYRYEQNRHSRVMIVSGRNEAIDSPHYSHKDNYPEEVFDHPVDHPLESTISPSMMVKVVIHGTVSTAQFLPSTSNIYLRSCTMTSNNSKQSVYRAD